jgi:hypothetical protein
MKFNLTFIVIFLFLIKLYYVMKINWLSVLGVVIAGMAIGFLWYGAVFNAQWMAGNGITMDGEKMLKNGVEIPMSQTPMIFNTITMVIYAIFMNWLIGKTGDNTWMKGGTLGFFLGLIMLIGIFINNMFASSSSSLSMVDGSYALTLWTLIGAIVGGLKKD